jgi:hypothetical protein
MELAAFRAFKPKDGSEEADRPFGRVQVIEFGIAWLGCAALILELAHRAPRMDCVE